MDICSAVEEDMINDEAMAALAAELDEWESAQSHLTDLTEKDTVPEATPIPEFNAEVG